MTNILVIISSRSKALLNRNNNSEMYGCNFRQREFCHLNNQSMTPGIVYKA